VLLTPFALAGRTRSRERWRMMRFWTALHLRNLLTSGAELRSHR
jgi:hypothetical protein